LPGNSPEQARGHLLDSFDEVADYAESAGVEVDIEEPGLLVECTDEVLELIDDVGSDALGVNLDIGHAAAYGEDPTEGVRKYAGNITGVHLKDIAGGRRGNIITESLAKAISIQERFEALDNIGYDGFATMELYTYPDAPDRAAAETYRFL